MSEKREQRNLLAFFDWENTQAYTSPDQPVYKSVYLHKKNNNSINELNLKMAVDGDRRKWLPREKVMPGKPGGDNSTRTSLTNQTAVRSSVAPAEPP